jgi:hypothetical protein
VSTNGFILLSGQAALDRFLFGFWSLFLSPNGIRRAAVILKPSTLFKP